MDGNINYSVFLSPFYLSIAGLTINSDTFVQSAYEYSYWWTSTSISQITTFGASGALKFGVKNTISQIILGSGFMRNYGVSLRCLTQ